MPDRDQPIRPMLRWHRVVMSGVAWFLHASSLTAQGVDSAALAPLCPVGAAPTVDTVPVTFGVWPASRRSKESSDSAAQIRRQRAYVDAIRRHFAAPASLGDVPIFGERKGDSGDTGRRSALGGSLYVITAADGRLRKATWMHEPYVGALANAVLAATEAADAAGAFTAAPLRGTSDDTTAVLIGTWRERQPSDAAAVMQVRVPSYLITQDLAVESRVQPTYPAELRLAGHEDAVGVTFIAGSDGRPQLQSLRVQYLRFPALEAPVRAAVRRFVFSPARSNGCAVPMLLSQRFEFRLAP